jgi:hypothetical protein
MVINVISLVSYMVTKATNWKMTNIISTYGVLVTLVLIIVEMVLRHKIGSGKEVKKESQDVM